MSVKNSRVFTAPIPKMPPGLVELMEGLAKDVLKSNPSDVYTFCANHMKNLIEIRDGPTPKRTMTVEQKIAIANKKVRERAIRRREMYDKKMQLFKQVCQNDEKKNLPDSGQYIKDKIVKIPEEDLSGSVEHEIIAKIQEPQSDSVCLQDSPSETTLLDVKSADTDAIKQEFNNTIHVKENCEINFSEKINNNAIVEEMNKIIIDEIELDIIKKIENDIKVTNIANSIDKFGTHADDKENSLNVFAKTDDVDESMHSDTILEKGSYSEAKAIDNNEQENCQEKNDNNFNNAELIAISDGEPKECNSNDKKVNVNEPINEIQQDNIKITMYSSINTEEFNKDNAMEDDVSSHFLEKQSVDRSTPATGSQTEEEEMPKTESNELQININNTSMDLETAAITIQKVFRAFLFRNKTLSTDDATNVDINLLIEENKSEDSSDISSMNVNKERRTLGLSRIDTVLQTVNEEKSLSQSTDDSSTLSSAATIIQAHVRGFLIRNKFNVNKNSSTSGIDSDGLSFTSIDGDNGHLKNRTILNIHIVPESGNFMSRDESMLTSIDLSLDGCSTNLHPLGYDRSERRKQLKREDAFQSISPPSNNSVKLSEDGDSVKEFLIITEKNKDGNEEKDVTNHNLTVAKNTVSSGITELNDDNILKTVDNLDTALEVKSLGPIDSPVKYLIERPHSLPEITSDEMDVVTPFSPVEEKLSSGLINDSKLIHTGEFHEVVLPTKVSRSETSVVRGE